MARSQQVRRLRLQQGVLAWLLSCYYRNRKNGGFVLPTATLLIIVAFLIMISLLARTANRVILVSGQRERVVIEGPTSESIDRARAKLEYLFSRGDLPTDPTEEQIEDLLAWRTRDRNNRITPRPGVDIYTLPDEYRCGSQDGNCLRSNANYTPQEIAPTWAYPVDLNGNGRTDDPNDGIAVYSIIGRILRNEKSAIPLPDIPQGQWLQDRRQRAANFVVNNAPQRVTGVQSGCPGGGNQANRITGRFPGSGAQELKNFQVVAVTIPYRVLQNPNSADTTLNAAIFQQDRIFNTVNKFGAWFRYDLEISPGPEFNWNGAIHTEGNLLVEGANAFTSYLISAPASCYYMPPDNSSVTARGLFTLGSFRDDDTRSAGRVLFHIHPGTTSSPQSDRIEVNFGDQNITDTRGVDAYNANNGTSSPAPIALNPFRIVLENRSFPWRPSPRDGGNPWRDYEDSRWAGSPLSRRIQIFKQECPPYVDDTYRADNRWGPKPSYERATGENCESRRFDPGLYGQLIPQTEERLIRNEPPSDRPDDYGLDGYWERRAARTGTRIIVGQRLELGNVGVWGGWRTYGRHDGVWDQSQWQGFLGETGTSPSDRGNRIYSLNPSNSTQQNSDPVINTYFNNATGEAGRYTREIYGLLYRNDTVTSNGIAAPGALDPLYPARLDVLMNLQGIYSGLQTAIDSERPHEQLQRRTQRDNLAAVQATAIYHHGFANGDLPLVCLSSTIHPGTEASYFNSITFGDPVSPADPTDRTRQTRYPSINANFVRPPGSQRLFPEADFFTGRGTANMEYGRGSDGRQAPFNANDFSGGTALMAALTNLAQFAGDPNGAFPPLQSNQRNQIHPDPILTMWGNFSNLRQTLASGSYDNLSPADRANLHTAGCTLGMLAQNVHWYLDWGYRGQGNDFHMPGRPDEPYQPNNSNPPDQVNPGDSGSSPNIQINLKRLASTLRMLQDGRLNEGAGNYEIGHGILNFISRGANTNNCRVNDPLSPPDPNCYNIPAEYYIAALARIRDAQPFNATDPNSPYQRWNRLVYLARFVNTWLQIVRDRTYGFRAYKPGDPVFSENSPNRTMDHDRDPNNRRLVYRFRTTKTHSEDPYGPVVQTGLTDPLLNRPVDVPCDLSLADINYFGYQVGNDPLNLNNRLVEREMIALARLCPTQPKYPSLFYLFPGDLNSDGQVGSGDQHGHDSASNSNDPSPYNQPSGSPNNRNELASEPYVLHPYIVAVNSGVSYEPFSLSTLQAIALEPRRNAPTDWVTPVERFNNLLNRSVTDREIYHREVDLLISDDSGTGLSASLSPYRLGFAEKALYNGRDAMTARVMDLDLDMMRRYAYNGVFWLSQGVVDPRNPVAGGVVYAFREDGMREDGILRPPFSSWQDYQAQWENPDNARTGPPLPFRMNANPNDALLDPPVYATGQQQRGISVKSIDFYADPERRIHGFRLRNGADIRRSPDNPYGLTFVSDNPAYIQAQLVGNEGFFNRHSFQEFQQLLPLERFYTFAEFYNRFDRQPSFAIAGVNNDTWRPAEIVADAISLLSPNYCDGYVENGIRLTNNITGDVVGGKPSGTGADCAQPDGTVRGEPSFRNSNVRTNPDDFGGLPARASLPRGPWAREIPYDMGAPIIVSSNGQHQYVRDNFTQVGWPTNRYIRFGEGAGKVIPPALTNSEFNAVIVSGVVPSRAGQQGYGGLHNFPRFLEHWGNIGGVQEQRILRIQGSLVQLSFSNYATGPFDQDAWERRQNPLLPEGNNIQEFINYYNPPRRVWGYDPGLQYAPAGPISRRMINIATDRSEYFLELTAQDPYICQLRRFVTPGLTCPVR